MVQQKVGQPKKTLPHHNPTSSESSPLLLFTPIKPILPPTSPNLLARSISPPWPKPATPAASHGSSSPAFPTPAATSPFPFPFPSPPSSPISSLPDDLLLLILSRVPLPSLPSLSSVSPRFSLLLSSPSFLSLRRSLSLSSSHLLSLSLSSSHLLTLTLLPLSPSPSPLSFSLPNFPLPFSHPLLLPLSHSIFALLPASLLRLHPYTLSISPAPPPLFPRKKFAAAALHNRIYLAGGTSRTSAVEAFDPDSNSWRVVAESPIRRYAGFGAAAGGFFFIIGGFRIGGARGAHVCAGTMDAWHVRTGEWARGLRAVPGGGCVVGAAGVGPHVYVVASNGVGVSFWRWEWEGEGRRGGDWVRLEPPPVRAWVGLGGAVRFSCAAIGEGRMAAVVHDLPAGFADRGGDAAAAEGAVLVYDVSGGEWTRGPNLPPGFRRNACTCVEL